MAIRMKREPLKRKLVLLAVDTQDVDPVGDESIWHNDQVRNRRHVYNEILLVLKGLFSLNYEF